MGWLSPVLIHPPKGLLPHPACCRPNEAVQPQGECETTEGSMGDLQDPTDGGTLVPYVWPYFVGIFPEI